MNCHPACWADYPHTHLLVEQDVDELLGVVVVERRLLDGGDEGAGSHLGSSQRGRMSNRGGCKKELDFLG